MKAGIGISLKSDGLAVGNSGLEIGFARTQDSTVASVSKIVGRGPTSSVRQPECGAGPITAVDWRGGLTLSFQNQDFVGWISRDPTLRSTNGLRVGMSQAEAAALGVRTGTSTLGDEFDLGGISGLIAAETGQVSVLWAGTVCSFR
ncbi:hypothetical protein [Tropicimonas sp. IMCC34043]|uniref:hypothetical protein n=1 Tax=Tropicimonas sp. IMCC34043 TaxID=2248760 RepID=UPI000E25828D|nr:hypothetical protein [Tropicimonas sp. IMCC34043]